MFAEKAQREISLCEPNYVLSSLTGWVAAVAFALWISAGSMIYSTYSDSLPLPTDNCLNTTFNNKYVFSSHMLFMLSSHYR